VACDHAGDQFYAVFEDWPRSTLFDESAKPRKFSPVENNGSGGVIALFPTSHRLSLAA
jgi:hypothetical protein